MQFWNTKNTIEPKREFYLKIKEYFLRVSDNQIPPDLLEEIISKVTDRIYSDYKRFWKQYPKSRKRYSTLKMEDIEHPFIKYLITDLLENKKNTEYRIFSKVLFKMNDVEFDTYLENKHWYETK